MGTENAGLIAAAESLGSTDIERQEAVQLDLMDTLGADLAGLPVGERRYGGELRATHGAAPGARGPGRPKGSANKRTVEIRDYILSRYRHPLEALAAIYSQPVDTLAKDLGCNKVDAVSLQIRAAEGVARYIESPMPTKVAVTGDGDVPLIVIHAHGAVQAAGGPAAPAFDLDAPAKPAPVIDHEPNQ